MKKTAIMLMFITIISKIIGFSREIFLANYYGASAITDAYIIATLIPSIIFAFVGRAISTIYIPMYNKIENKSGKDKAQEYTHNLSNILIIASLAIIILGMIFTEHVVRLFASGFDSETLLLATKFTQISFWGLIFIALTNLYSAWLQIKGNYLIPSLISIPMNIIVILSIIGSAKYGIIFLPFGILFSIVGQFLFLMPSIIRRGYRHKLTLDFGDPQIKKMAMLALPIILGVAINDINLIVDKSIASHIIEGGISGLSYANRLSSFMQAIVVTSIATVMFPTISKLAAANKISNFKRTIAQSINGVLFLVVPASIGSIIFSKEIVELLFGRGSFNEQAIRVTSNALLFYSLGMISLGVKPILTKGLYSLEDTRTPAINSAIGVALNIVLNLILSRYLGLGGLALATSMAGIITSILMYASLRKKIGPFGLKQISISFLKILFSALIMGALSKVSFNYITGILSQNLSLIAAIALGAVVYFIVIYFMKIEDVDVIVGAIKKRLGRGAT